jgi:hypothetical protein
MFFDGFGQYACCITTYAKRIFKRIKKNGWYNMSPAGFINTEIAKKMVFIFSQRSSGTSREDLFIHAYIRIPL